jgi:DNA (cytosine-5)-methyltransferase 1
MGLREKVWGVEKKFKEGQKKQRLDDLFIHFLDFANRIKPKVIVAENVKGLIRKRARGYVNEIIKKFSDIGYETQIFLLNSAFMGVPQRRERVFFIARRKDLNLKELRLEFNEKPIKYSEFKDKNYIPLSTDTQTYKLWQKRRFGDGNLGYILKREENRYSSYSAVFLYDKKISPTTTAHGGFLRFDVPGKPSARDLITIQTFPQDYDFNGQLVGYVCGMSVPPIMMEKIAKQIYIQIFKGAKDDF